MHDQLRSGRGYWAKLFVPMALFLGLAGCPETKEPPRLPRRTSPIPETALKRNPAASGQERSQREPISLKTALSLPLVKRFSSPGAVRWRVELNHPVNSIRWSPLAGLVVSAGNEIHNVTSRGENRWRYVAGKGSRVFAMDSLEVVWSPAFHRLSGLSRGGRQQWAREWKGRLNDDGRGGVYLFDASTAAALGQDGTDRWRVAIDGVRKLNGPFLCADGMLFHGSSGLQRIVIRVSPLGRVLSSAPLGRGALLLGAGPSCAPLVWGNGKLSLMGERGRPRWQMDMAEAPFIQRLKDGFAVISGHQTQSRLTVFRDDGTNTLDVPLPIVGRITSTEILSAADGTIDAVGICLDVSSPCARPEGTRGPHNVLITSGLGQLFRVLIRHIQGHLDFAQTRDGGFVVASSSTDNVTELVKRDAQQRIEWRVALPGRLSSGPYIGPSAEIYLATCVGWECRGPYTLFAVTGSEQELIPDTGE